jgi:hypothetical protein
MMGWRVGYVAFPPRLSPQLFKVQDTIVRVASTGRAPIPPMTQPIGGTHTLMRDAHARRACARCAPPLASRMHRRSRSCRTQTVRAQAICPTIASQKLALGALAAGRGWVSEHVAGLAEQKALVLDALAPLGEGAVQGGSGAIYLFCRLPRGITDDVAAVSASARERCCAPLSARGVLQRVPRRARVRAHASPGALPRRIARRLFDPWIGMRHARPRCVSGARRPWPRADARSLVRACAAPRRRSARLLRQFAARKGADRRYPAARRLDCARVWLRGPDIAAARGRSSKAPS